MRRSLVIACLLASACTAVTPPPSATAAPSASPAPASVRPATRLIALGNGLVLDVPLSWQTGPAANVNWATQRLALSGNGDLATLPTIPNNGDVDASTLPGGRVVVEVESFCRMSCQGPETETTLPLDWTLAAPLFTRTLPSDRHEAALGFRWFDQPIYLVARWADDAPASDISAIAAIARSIRPDPAPPVRGEYRGWDAVGAPIDFPVGTVRLEPLPAGAVIRPQYRVWDNVPFFLVQGRQHLYAFTTRPLVDRRCEIRYDDGADHFTCTVEERTYEWTRFGRYLGPEPSSDLAQHRVLVREGVVWVRYLEASLLVPSVRDEAAERSAEAPSGS